MRRILLLLLLALMAPAAASAQERPKPRKAAADTARAERRPAGDSIVFASELATEDEEGEEESPAAQEDRLRPFAVESSGSVAPRPKRGEVVWVDTPPARPAARDTGSERPARDTAATTRPPRTASRDTASSRPTRTSSRDTATAARPPRTASRDTAATRPARTASRDTAAARPTRTGPRDTVTIRPPRTAARDTVRIRGGEGGRTGTGATTPTRARTHRVQPGETWYGIARRYGVTSAQLRAVNPDVEWQSIRTGQVLNLPASARDSRAPATSATPPRTGQGSRAARTHTVAAGETLFGIARRYGVTTAALREANDLETDGVRTGQRLVIPPPP